MAFEWLGNESISISVEIYKKEIDFEKLCAFVPLKGKQGTGILRMEEEESQE